MIGLDQTAVVLTRTAATGQFTTTAQTALPCRLALVGTGPNAADDEQDRAELANVRRLLWSGVYQMPETAQVEVDSVRWNVIPGTVTYVRGPTSSVVYGRAECQRAT